MTVNSLSSFSDVLRKIINYLFAPRKHCEILYPKNYEDILQILHQATDNRTAIKVTGGSYPLAASSTDIVINLLYINRLLGLDVYQQTVVAESGMRLSALSKVLETVSLSLDIYGRVPDLTICDAIATGVFGGNVTLLSSILSCEVALQSGKIVSWTWEKNPSEMQALCCGLGMIAIVLSVTFKCVPLQRYTEISYLCSIRDIMENWTLQMKSSFCQQITWFPFSEFIVMTHLNQTETFLHPIKQSFVHWILERLSEMCSRHLRVLSLLSSRHIPIVSSILGRVQFVSQWTLSKHRSDFSHTPPRFWSPVEACRGSNWLMPAEALPLVLYHISMWSHANPTVSAAPLFVQSIKMEATPPSKPFLAPYLDAPMCSVWYDWFMPETDPDPILISEFEEIFHSVGARRAWWGERLTSPLVLQDTFPKYGHWCRVKAKMDPENQLNSAYVHGTVYSMKSERRSNLLQNGAQHLDVIKK